MSELPGTAGAEWNFFLINFRCISSMASWSSPVGSLLRKVKPLSSFSLSLSLSLSSRSTDMAQLSKSWPPLLFFPLKALTVLFSMQVSSSAFIQLLPVKSTSCGSGLRGRCISDCSHEARTNTNGAKAVEWMPPSHPNPTHPTPPPHGGPGPIKCLRWHDSSPQKCP